MIAKRQMLLVLLLTFYAQTYVVQTAEPERIFNGRNLDGWSGNPDLWSVQDGAIVGSSVGNKIKANTFLIWQGNSNGDKLKDFRLTLKAKLEGKNNSGVQYRSQLANKKTWKAVGYQADMHPQPEYTAMLYSEGTGRGILATRGTKGILASDPKQSKLDNKAFATSPIDITQWHEYSITAQGNHLVHQLDGKTTVDVIDEHEKRSLQGILALQLHAGPPMTVYFKDIELTLYDSTQTHIKVGSADK